MKIERIKDMRFESSVISKGSKAIPRRDSYIAEFESSVISKGSKAKLK